MKHYQPKGIRTFFHALTIEFEGSPKCGAAFDVEVEFTATPDTPARLYGEPGDCYPAEAGDREIVAVRPYRLKKNSYGFVSTEREYLDCPEWLAWEIKDCIDVDSFDVDWSEDE